MLSIPLVLHSMTSWWTMVLSPWTLPALAGSPIIDEPIVLQRERQNVKEHDCIRTWSRDPAAAVSKACGYSCRGSAPQKAVEESYARCLFQAQFPSSDIDSVRVRMTMHGGRPVWRVEARSTGWSSGDKHCRYCDPAKGWCRWCDVLRTMELDVTSGSITWAPELVVFDGDGPAETWCPTPRHLADGLDLKGQWFAKDGSTSVTLRVHGQFGLVLYGDLERHLASSVATAEWTGVVLPDGTVQAVTDREGVWLELHARDGCAMTVLTDLGGPAFEAVAQSPLGILRCPEGCD